MVLHGGAVRALKPLWLWALRQLVVLPLRGSSLLLGRPIWTEHAVLDVGKVVVLIECRRGLDDALLLREIA